MPGLTRIPFTPDLLPKVQGFACGDKPYEREVSDWIKAPRGGRGAIDELEQGNEVWLYLTEEGDLVGFGSFGVALQRWPRPKDPQIPASVIPMLGVDRKFKKQPPGPREQHYSAQILADLVLRARAHVAERPILILYVNEQNIPAINFYLAAGFVELHKPYKDKNTGYVNKRMVLALTAPTS